MAEGLLISLGLLMDYIVDSTIRDAPAKHFAFLFGDGKFPPPNSYLRYIFSLKWRSPLTDAGHAYWEEREMPPSAVQEARLSISLACEPRAPEVQESSEGQMGC